MEFGLFDLNRGACVDPQVLVRVARQAEAAGFESLWCGEHVVLSGGRLMFGLGGGYLEPEFRALGVSLKDHGPRADEYLAAMRSIWSEPKPASAGRVVSFSGIDAFPRPLQQPTPPLVVGGHSLAAFRRSVGHARGWDGVGLDPERTAAAMAGLRRAAAHCARSPELGRLEVSVTPPTDGERDVAQQYAELGGDRLILRPPRRAAAAAFEACVARIGDTLVGHG